MNWVAITAVAEVVGVVAVLITLIYLAVQIKQNTAAVSTSTYESVMTGSMTSTWLSQAILSLLPCSIGGVGTRAR